jgi:hypothetical protein
MIDTYDDYSLNNPINQEELPEQWIRALRQEDYTELR